MRALAVIVCVAGCRVGWNARSRPALASEQSSGVKVDEQGRLVGDAHDGYYALYRDGAYRGLVRRAGDDVMPLHASADQEPGDVLVERKAKRRLLDFAVDGVTVVNEFGLAAGLGIHLRQYALDGGLQLGANAAFLRGGGTTLLIDGELGWGVWIAPGFVVSASAAVGRAAFIREGIGENGGDVTGSALAITPFVRLRAAVTPHFYFAVDAGVVFTGELMLRERTSYQLPISRITAGFDL